MKDERWLSDGNCKKCRRKKYCKKPCTANKRRKESKLNSAVMSLMAKIMMGDGK